MEYNFSKDLKSIREILGISQSEFADQIGVAKMSSFFATFFQKNF